MTVWRSVPAGFIRLCGCCGEEIPPGARVCLITVAGVRRTLVRCAHCAAPPRPAEDVDAVEI